MLVAKTYLLVHTSGFVLAAHADAEDVAVALAELDHADVALSVAFWVESARLEHTLLLAGFHGWLVAMPALVRWFIISVFLKPGV